MGTRIVACLALWSLLATQALSAPATCKVENLVELPVTMVGLSPMVDASFEGKPARLMADSGAFFGIVSSATAAQYKLKLSPAPVGMRVQGVGGSALVSIATVRDFGLAGLKLHNVPFLVGGSEMGNEAAGNLGQNILGIVDVEYDLTGGAIRLMRPHDCSEAFLAYWSTPAQVSVLEIEPTNETQLFTKGTAYVNGNKIKVEFDTGASTSFLSLHAAALAGVKPEDSGVVPGGDAIGIGRGRVSSWIAPFASFKIGNEEIRNTHLRIGDAELRDVDMIIGADFFLSHRVYVATSQRKLYFSYHGGPVFNLTTGHAAATASPPAAAPTAAAPEAPAPLDAEALARRGAASLARREYESALADLTQACALAPAEDKYLLQRSHIYLQSGQRPAALADLDHALTLRPDNVDALVLRATLRLGDGKVSDALADLGAADRAAAREANIRIAIGEGYLSADQFALAVAQFDLWIKIHPDDSHQPEALNDRCWARALWGQDLDQADKDCNAALKRTTKATSAYAAIIDSRALVRLRQGDCAGALSDYNAALAAQPKSEWSLYGRGVCQVRQGRTAEGNADIAAAKALGPEIEARAKKLGIGP